MPIGRPLVNTELYVLGPDLVPVGVGVVGDLYIGGLQVGGGYVGAPVLTAERFVPDGWSGEAGSRLYWTGDRVRWREDGLLEFVGRTDDQVKIRGLRIELGEVEAVLRAQPGVRDGVVVSWRDDLGEAHLGALVVLAAGCSLSAVRQGVGRRLPWYMVPERIVVVEKVPLIANGKADKRAVAALLREVAGARVSGTPPQGPIEEMLAEVWRKVLGAPVVWREDDFFAMGGHSLAAMRVVGLVEQAVGRRLSVQALLQGRTLAEVAAAVGASGPQAAGAEDDAAAALGDAVLAPEIGAASAAGWEPWQASDPGAVLLTGATGFVGAFLLRELLAATQATVYCLVRGGTEAACRERLVAAWRCYGLPVETLGARVVVVPGDLAEPYFGLSEAAFEDSGAGGGLHLPQRCAGECGVAVCAGAAVERAGHGDGAAAGRQRPGEAGAVRLVDLGAGAVPAGRRGLAGGRADRGGEDARGRLWAEQVGGRTAGAGGGGAGRAGEHLPAVPGGG